MDKNQKLDKTSYGIHLPFEKVIASACILTFLLSPVTPLFANEEVPSENTDTHTEDSSSENETSSGDDNHEEITVADTEAHAGPEPTEEAAAAEPEPLNTESETLLEEDGSTQADPVTSNQNTTIEEQVPNEEVLQSTISTDPQGSASDPHSLGTGGSSGALEATTTEGQDPDILPSATSSEEIGNAPEVPGTLPIEVEHATTVPQVATLDESEIEPEQEEGANDEVPSVVTEETMGNDLAFQKNECVAVSEGTYYCTKLKVDRVPLHVDRIFAASDEDGDKEIFVEKDSQVTQVTHNILDDDAPYFDESANRMVWHRLIDGRYQIISYDVLNAEETQITYDRYNNMNPNSFGDAVVWQGWVGNDWEIFILVGNEQKMITDNTTHDIAPSINGTHIVWQSFEGDVWRMKLYDIRTGTIETIGDADGSIQNPRFVLVYDTTLESGDIETRGYDLKSGEVVPLSATPKPIPTEIPDPEQTGEERALVTTTTQPKSKTEDNDDDQNDTVGSAGPDPKQEPEGTLVIPPLVTESQIAASSTTDVVLGTTTDATLGQNTYDHIEDIVVTPLSGVDIVPQETVAEVE